MVNSQRLRQFVEGDHSRISLSALKAAQILLADTRTLFDLLLRQILLAPEASKIATDQFAHIHAIWIAVYVSLVYQL
jgi:thiosulfate reductase cytochrome b subunit